MTDLKIRLSDMPSKLKLAMLAVLGIVGILLVVIGTSGEKKPDAQKNISENTEDNSTSAYIESIENKIRNITRQITGSDNVGVIVTVSDGVQYVYVSDEKSDSAGTDREYVTVRNENGAGALILQKEIYPPIEGVCVACRGGDDPSIQAKLISVIATALGLTSNRICIVGVK